MFHFYLLYLFQIDLNDATIDRIKHIIRNIGLESNKLSKNNPINKPTMTPATISIAILRALLAFEDGIILVVLLLRNLSILF
jgi:hypothetical protein